MLYNTSHLVQGILKIKDKVHNWHVPHLDFVVAQIIVVILVGMLFFSGF